MDKLKGLLNKKKQEHKSAVGDRKWLKRSEVEDFNRPTKTQRVTDATPAAQPDAAPMQPTVNANVLEPLPDDEVKRRLRRLGEPATMFGEDADVRAARLRHAEATLVVQDEGARHGDRENVLLKIRQEDRERAQRSQNGEESSAPEASAARATGGAPRADQGGAADAPESEEAETERAFREAAERLRASRELATMSTDQRIASALKGYMAEWKADLDARTPEAANTTMGVTATNGFRQTEKSFEVLYARLEAAEVHHEIRNCLVTILDALAQRNYQRANEVYLQLSIGNQAWPIGVTSVGIHDRSAREALAQHRNVKSQAHIMNDEATRKYLHGISRLIKGVQGLRPTDPSRSVNFNAFQHGGLGAKGGAQKEHLLQLKGAGDTWQHQGMAPAPHLLADDGRNIAIPPTFGQMMRSVQNGSAADAGDRKQG